MYRLLTKDSKININVTGDFLTCYAETEKERIYKTIKKNTISLVELRQGTSESKKGNLYFFGFGILLVLVAAFLLFFLKDSYQKSLEFYLFLSLVALLGVVFMVVCRPRTKEKNTIFLHITNSNNTPLLILPLGEFNKDISECVNKLALDILSTKKPNVPSEALNEVFDLESTTWN